MPMHGWINSPWRTKGSPFLIRIQAVRFDLLGTEFGLKYQFNPSVFAGTSGRVEFGLDGRSGGPPSLGWMDLQS